MGSFVQGTPTPSEPVVFKGFQRANHPFRRSYVIIYGYTIGLVPPPVTAFAQLLRTISFSLGSPTGGVLPGPKARTDQSQHGKIATRAGVDVTPTHSPAARRMGTPAELVEDQQKLSQTISSTENAALAQ